MMNRSYFIKQKKEGQDQVLCTKGLTKKDAHSLSKEFFSKGKSSFYPQCPILG